MDGGGLAGTVGTEQPEELTRRDVEVEAVDRQRVAVALGETVRVDREEFREIGRVAHHGGGVLQQSRGWAGCSGECNPSDDDM